MRYLIIGGGVAGTTAAEELRKRDTDAEITLVDEEHHPLYSRVMLGLYIKCKVERERVFLKKETWYAEKNIEWLPGTVAESLDIKNKFVRLSNGREFPYDKLLIATGTSPRPMDMDVRGVSYLRTIDDADHLLQLIAEQSGKESVAVYGSGFISCEYVEAFRERELPIKLFYRGERFWSKSLLPEAGQLVDQFLKDGGVEVHSGTLIEDVLGEKELESVETSKGSHPVSILGVGIGVIPELGWLHDAGLEIGVGVKANAFLQTSDENVFVAGDVAEFEDGIVGRQRSIRTWQNSMMQGRHVAGSMIGEEKPFELLNSYAIEVCGLSVVFIGDTDVASADKVHMIGSFEERGITQVFERDGKVVGGVMLNRNNDRALITKAIKEKQSFSDLKFVAK